LNHLKSDHLKSIRLKLETPDTLPPKLPSLPLCIRATASCLDIPGHYRPILWDNYQRGQDSYPKIFKFMEKRVGYWTLQNRGRIGGRGKFFG
jgi:hypothetical protein